MPAAPSYVEFNEALSRLLDLAPSGSNGIFPGGAGRAVLPQMWCKAVPPGGTPGGGYVFLRWKIAGKLNTMRHIRDKRSESNAVIYPRFRAQIGLFTNIFLDSVPPSPQEQRRSAACYYFRISRRNVMQMAGTNLARQTEPVSVETGRGNAI